jgi:hypothetical protein
MGVCGRRDEYRLTTNQKLQLTFRAPVFKRWLALKANSSAVFFWNRMREYRRIKTH